MNSIFKTWKTNRKLYLDFIDKYSLDQLNEIPNGFNNNLVWNIGHIIVAQQILTYKSSGLEGYLPKVLLEQYSPGTKPVNPVLEDELLELKRLLISLTEKTESDYRNGVFGIYKERTTSMGFHLNSIEEALIYNNYHEGLHFGCMLSIRKFL